MKPRRALLLAGSLVVSVVASDIAISLIWIQDGMLRGRPLPPFGATPHPRQRQWVEGQRQSIARGQTGGFDVELGWVPPPNSAGEEAGQRFNSIASRGSREYGVRPPDDGLRIVAFGDSFTYGAGVTDDEAWSSRLESLKPETEVLNFAVGAYGTDQALMRFRREGLHGAHVAIMGLLVENIGRNVNRYRPAYFTRTYNAAAKPRFVLEDGELRLVPIPFRERSELVEAVADGSILERLVENEYWAGDGPLLPGSSLSRLAAAWTAYSRRQPWRLWRDTEGEPFRVTLAILEAFHAEARGAGARRVLVLVFPRSQELERLDSRGDRDWQTLLDALEERGIPYLDLATVLLDPWRRGEVGFVQGHLDPAGNQTVAESVRDWLDD